MTTPVLFLIGAVGLSVLLGVIVWLASRPRKEKFGSSIESFNSDLAALAPKQSNQRKHSSNRLSSRASGERPRPGPRSLR